MGRGNRLRNERRQAHARAVADLGVKELLAERDALREELEAALRELSHTRNVWKHLADACELQTDLIKGLGSQVCDLRSQLEPALRVCRAIDRQLQATVNLEHASHDLTQALAAQRKGDAL